MWSASVVSGLGGAITRLALPLLAALTLNATPAQMGLLVAAENVPDLLFGLATGVWVDRRAKKPVMIAADVGRAALLLFVPVAAWLGVLRIELLLVIVLLVGTLGVFFEIASQSYLPVILPAQELTAGNARLHTGYGIAEIGGPGLAGWLTQLFSAPIAILVDGLSYVARKRRARVSGASCGKVSVWSGAARSCARPRRRPVSGICSTAHDGRC
ncbi:MAG: MFS transporter [Chloroflexia bacterium]|nr:MFS transporter [Chloroflexia bacterium]